MTAAPFPSGLGDGVVLAGRLLLAAIFLHEAFDTLENYAATVAYMKAGGVPGLLLPAVIAVQAGGGLSVALGYRSGAAALLLAGFCLAAAVLFHAHFADRNQLLHFEKNLAMAGGFLLLWAHGPGRWALGAKAKAEG